MPFRIMYVEISSRIWRSTFCSASRSHSSSSCNSSRINARVIFDDTAEPKCWFLLNNPFEFSYCHNNGRVQIKFFTIPLICVIRILHSTFLYFRFYPAFQSGKRYSGLNLVPIPCRTIFCRSRTKNMRKAWYTFYISILNNIKAWRRVPYRLEKFHVKLRMLAFTWHRAVYEGSRTRVADVAQFFNPIRLGRIKIPTVDGTGQYRRIHYRIHTHRVHAYLHLPRIIRTVSENETWCMCVKGRPTFRMNILSHRVVLVEFWRRAVRVKEAKSNISPWLPHSSTFWSFHWNQHPYRRVVHGNQVFPTCMHRLRICTTYTYKQEISPTKYSISPQ